MLRRKEVMEPEVKAVMEIEGKRLHGLKLKVVCIKVLCSVHCYLQLSWII